MPNKLIATMFAIMIVFSASVALAQEKSAEKTGSADPSGVILRGESMGDSPVVTLDAIAEDPARYENKKIILEGTIGAVCQKKGCWMTMIPAEGGQPVHVTFFNYGFFVPKDAAGLKVRAEGKIELTTLSKEEVEHRMEEGQKMNCEHDGTAREIGFVATAVEIYKKSE